MTDERTMNGGQADAVADQSDQADSASSDAQVELEVQQMSEEEAWKTFPKQVQAAITYAGSNKYDYGPKLRKVELDYTVLNAEAMTDEITRVKLSYRPKNSDKAESGSEYLDIDRDGVVQARRQIHIPKESMPWLLIGITALSIIAAVILVPLIILADEKGDPTFVAGRTLWVQSGQPRVEAYVTYDAIDSEGTPRKWIVVPEGEGTSIAFVTVRLINQTSGVVNLAIDTDAVQITTDDGVQVSPVDLLARVAWPVDNSELDTRLNILELPLWGNKLLKAGEEISGFVAFEVPTGSKISALRWSATDVANIRY